ncbi:MAG: hypothetical protein VX278_06435 [Myxococcota bacterium]|nr:hypothetical protein [Myxococcota bacterium]
MSFIKIKGSGWCEQCECEQPAFFTRLVQYNDKKEVQGVCAKCEHPVRREFVAPVPTHVPSEIAAEESTSSAVEEASGKTQAVMQMHKETKAPVPSSKRPTLLSLLLVACCLLFIDQYFL